MRSTRTQRSPVDEDERRTAAAAPQERVPAPDPQALVPSSVLALQRSAGNAAMASVLARRRTDPKAQSRELEARIDALGGRFKEYGTQILEASDEMVDTLRACAPHLVRVGQNHKTAWRQFVAVLKAGDEEKKADDELMGIVQGLAIGMVLGVIGPELIALRLGKKIAGSVGQRAGAALVQLEAGTASLGLKAGAALAGEGAETLAGQGIDKFKSSQMPSDTAALGGPSDSDMFESCLGQLNEMINLLPPLGLVGDQQKDIALALSQLARRTVAIRAGEEGKDSAKEIEEQLGQLQALEPDAQQMVQMAIARRASVSAIAQAVFALEIKPVHELEDRIWRNWIARLPPGTDDVLDNDAIEEYLHARGLMDSGAWTSDEDERDTVHAAQAWLLKEQGIDPGSRGGVTESRWKAQQELARRKQAVVGKVGKVERIQTNRALAWVRVGAHRLPMAYMGSGYVEGDMVEVTELQIQRHLATADANIENWDDDEKFEARVRRSAG
jgi:hypothetical protein